MHRGDRVRSVHQQPRRPQRVGQVVTARLKLGGQAAIADQHGIADQFHNATVGWSAGGRAAAGSATRGPRWGYDRDTPETRIARLGEWGAVGLYVSFRREA